MIEYDFILSTCTSLEQRIDTLRRCSDDPIEIVHLNAARWKVADLRKTINMARECHDHPRQIVYAVGGMDEEEADRINGFTREES